LNEALALAPNLPFALQAPRYQQTTAEAPPDELRSYRIQAPGGRSYPAYVIVVGQGELGQYYDIQGTTWTGSPLLSDPSQQLHIGSRSYSLFYDGEHIKTVAWREGSAAYWIENTLTYGLSPQAMVAIARETRPVGSPEAPARVTDTSPQRSIPLPQPGAAATSTVTKLAVALGFVTLAIVVLLGSYLLLRQRELKLLRAQVAQAMTLEARHRARKGL
jgi:hypothetical protein